MKFNTIDDLKASGFEGFIPVAQLQTDSTAIPRTAGVYMVVYTGENIPEFLPCGTGGFFKGKDPNVSITELETNWVKNTCVVYIGKAGTTLRKRLNQYLKFGNRQNIGHWGGRYIWQIKIPAICCCAGNLLPTKIPKRSKPHSSPDSKNSAGDTDHSPISKIKGRGDLYVESRQKFYFALIPIFRQITYLQYEKISLLRHCRVLWRRTILTIVSQIQWYPAQTTQQYLFSPDRVTVLAASVPTVSPSGCGNRWTHRGR